jgi:putative tricarboxylic transport membrane protein
MILPGKLLERLVPVVLLIVAGSVLIGVWRLPNTATADLVGPKLYPGALAVLLAILSGLLLTGVAPQHKGDSSITLPGMLRRFLPLVVFSAVYVIVLPPLGFLISTTTMLLSCFYLLGERRLWLNLLIAAGFALASYLLFAKGLGIQLTAFPG